MHQANGPDSTGGGAASGGKFDKITALSRRAAFAGMVVAPLAVTAMGVAHADTRTFEAAIGEVRRAQRHLDVVIEERSVAERAYMDAVPDRPEGFFGIGDTVETYNARCEAERAAWRRAEADAKQRHGVAAADAKVEAALDAVRAAIDQVLAMQATSIAMVIRKLELAQEEELELAAIDPILSDLRRLGANA